MTPSKPPVGSSDELFLRAAAWAAESDWHARDGRVGRAEAMRKVADRLFEESLAKLEEEEALSVATLEGVPHA